MNGSIDSERIFPRMRVTKVIQEKAQTRQPAAPTADEAFQTLFQENWTGIYRLLVRMVGDPAEAEDLALETFFRFYQHAPMDGEGANLRGWLYRVATNLGLHSIRGEQRRQHYELEAGKHVLEETSPEKPPEVLENKETNHQARLALSQMNPRQAQLLVLRYSGMAYKEIALVLSLAPTSIGPLLLRAEHEFSRIYQSLSREEP